MFGSHTDQCVSQCFEAYARRSHRCRLFAAVLPLTLAVSHFADTSLTLLRAVPFAFACRKT